MRLIPALTALLVLATLYLVVMERDAVMRFAQGERVALSELNPFAPEPEAQPERAVTEPVAETAAETAVHSPCRYVGFKTCSCRSPSGADCSSEHARTPKISSTANAVFIKLFIFHSSLIV